jgi:colanic acid/amylovoran biosynthesis glycosyltransferase
VEDEFLCLMLIIRIQSINQYAGMNKQLILLTDSFPFGMKETFLEAEVGFLANAFESVHFFPLQGGGDYRPQAANVVVHTPFLSFDPKDQKRLLCYGLFNFSPFGFALKELVAKSVYKNYSCLRVWAAAIFVLRAAYGNRVRMKELMRLINDETVVYSYWGDKLVLIIPLLKRSYPSLKSVVRFHRTDLYEEFKSGYIPFRSLLLPSVDHCIFISEDGQHYLEKRYANLIRHAHLFRLGVFDRGMNPANTSSVFHLVSCSYVVSVKRIPLLIEALKRLDFPLKWTHIGTGDQFEYVSSLSTTIPSSIEVEFLGSKTNQEVLAYYATTRVDLFINVSESEGVPVSIMEALSFGIPVIATNAGGTGEIVDDTVGVLLPVEVIAEKIADALNQFYNRTDKSIFRTNARNRWQERCDATKNYSGFVKFLLSIK